MKTKTIKQTIIINANPEQVYDVLMNSKKHAKLIGDKARINNKVNGKFSIYNGYITGKNLVLEKNKKIIQEWTATDFPKSHKSKVIFELKKQGNRTKLVFTHKNVPLENYKDIKQGWIDYYWNPLKEMFK